MPQETPRLRTLVLCALLATCGVALCQTRDPYTFKGNWLGMSLKQFKVQDKGQQVLLPYWDPSIKKKNKMTTHAFNTPLCSDTISGFDTETIGPHEVVCNPSPGNVNLEARTVAGVLTDRIHYRFYKGKLCSISIDFPHFYFGAISRAFEAKYGKPTSTKLDSYENAFGATWTGTELYWERGKESIGIMEGAGGGPGQKSTANDESIVVISDQSLGPNSSAKPIVDF